MTTPHIYLIIRYPVTGITPTQPYLEILCFQSICNLNASPPVQRATNINSSLPIRSFLDGWFLASTPTLKLSPTCLFLDVASQRGVKIPVPGTPYAIPYMHCTCIMFCSSQLPVNCQSSISQLPPRPVAIYCVHPRPSPSFRREYRYSQPITQHDSISQHCFTPSRFPFLNNKNWHQFFSSDLVFLGLAFCFYFFSYNPLSQIARYSTELNALNPHLRFPQLVFLDHLFPMSLFSWLYSSHPVLFLHIFFLSLSGFDSCDASVNVMLECNVIPPKAHIMFSNRLIFYSIFIYLISLSAVITARVSSLNSWHSTPSNKASMSPYPHPL